MTLAKLKASPFGVGDELTSVEMNILNDEIANALDIINGGVYVSLAPVSTDTTWTFAGAGNTVVFASSVFWSNGATFNGAAEFNSTLALNGVTTVNNDITITGSGTLLSVAGSATTPTFASGIHVTAGTTTLDNSVICNDTLSVHNNLIHDAGTATFSATMAITGTLNLQTLVNVGVGGVAAGIKKRTKFMPDADTTIAANTFDEVVIGALTADRNLTLNDCPDGTPILISGSASSGMGAHQVNLKNQAGSLLAIIKYNTSTFINWALLTRNSSNWTFVIANIIP